MKFEQAPCIQVEMGRCSPCREAFGYQGACVKVRTCTLMSQWSSEGGATCLLLRATLGHQVTYANFAHAPWFPSSPLRKLQPAHRSEQRLDARAHMQTSHMCAGILVVL